MTFEIKTMRIYNEDKTVVIITSNTEMISYQPNETVIEVRDNQRIFYELGDIVGQYQFYTIYILNNIYALPDGILSLEEELADLKQANAILMGVSE